MEVEFICRLNCERKTDLKNRALHVQKTAAICCIHKLRHYELWKVAKIIFFCPTRNWQPTNYYRLHPLVSCVTLYIILTEKSSIFFQATVSTIKKDIFHWHGRKRRKNRSLNEIQSRKNKFMYRPSAFI